MQNFESLVKLYAERFNIEHFPQQPINLYEPAAYFLTIGGKRIRPVTCLMAAELFGTIQENAWWAAHALELFHNFTLLHDDVMDNSEVRRGKQTIHVRNGLNTAILSGDVMLIYAYQYLGKITAQYLPQILSLFNTTAIEVCEGQQLDMDFETRDDVAIEEYIKMITLKTSVLLACSLQTGAILGNASVEDQYHMYQFGLNLGIAFQIQDDYLDCYGDFAKFGKAIGGDIKQNKKTALLLKTLELATEQQKEKLKTLLIGHSEDKVEKVIAIYNDCKVDIWAKERCAYYANKALEHLSLVNVSEERKIPLQSFANYLLNRES